MTKSTTLIRERMGSYIQWSITKEELGNRTPVDIMMEQGYHPAGYGEPFQIQEEGDLIYFRCWASCD